MDLRQKTGSFSWTLPLHEEAQLGPGSSPGEDRMVGTVRTVGIAGTVRTVMIVRTVRTVETAGM